MKKQDSHPIVTNVVATVVATAIVACLAEVLPPVKGVLSWISNKASAFTGLVSDTYRIPGWLLMILGICLIVVLIQLLIRFRVPGDSPSTYDTDTINGAVWRWNWVSGEVCNLWCFCATCDAELVYDDSSCDTWSRRIGERHRTDFICEHCNRTTRATVEGGNKEYAMGYIEREVRRRLRIRNQAPQAAKLPST